MNQIKIFETRKRKSQSESEIKSICLITFEYQSIKKYSNKRSQSQEQLIDYSSTIHILLNIGDEDSVSDQESQLECQINSTTLMNYQQVPSLLSIYTSESNISAEEEFEIWDDNQDLRVLKIVLEDQQPSIKQFLQLYKARFGAFPGQQQCIKNEEVIKTAITYASSSKQLFKKYFPSKRIVFEDDIDYSEPYKIEEDHHFQTFNDFFKHKKTKILMDF
ncbi:unnamed protein product (macronuclear) [Paramecium tetraurelia]|uniref:Uncharacterized protein n=1 Tax=Paramecium tetraurelia TaxID=5888 RepID=A0C2X2_PARTE|nr:uncharacterized protein GSPATT00034617001 [Paramecium tetraurelia]CAK65139.1 unnamed protein product [Paramecium tetraurelia]|eukprot:XP_001432536.1 hypothetical protein (macronuclear) [Paramecium tetraurelia strain d4-2]